MISPSVHLNIFLFYDLWYNIQHQYFNLSGNKAKWDLVWTVTYYTLHKILKIGSSSQLKVHVPKQKESLPILASYHVCSFFSVLIYMSRWRLNDRECITNLLCHVEISLLDIFSHRNSFPPKNPRLCAFTVWPASTRMLHY